MHIAFMQIVTLYEDPLYIRIAIFYSENGCVHQPYKSNIWTNIELLRRQCVETAYALKSDGCLSVWLFEYLKLTAALKRILNGGSIRIITAIL